MNRITGLKTWMDNNDIKEEYIIFIDPDFLFMRSITENDWNTWNVSRSNIICGRDIWREPTPGFNYNLLETYVSDRRNINSIPPSIVPVICHIDDLKFIVDRWADLTIKIHQSKFTTWTAELFAFDLICRESNINVTATKSIYHIPTDDKIASAPFLHYFHPFTNFDNTWFFSKYDWRHAVPENLQYPKHLRNNCYATSFFIKNISERFGGKREL